MSPDLASILPYLLIGLVLAALIVAFIIRNGRRTDVIRDGQTPSRDVLDEGATRAQRNQALIDAPHAVEKVFGQTSANANSQATGAAPADADAEAGASVAPTRTTPPPAPLAPTEPAPAPAPAPEPRQAAPRPDSPPPAAGRPADDLTQIKGVGPKLVTLLAELGITRFEQIAHWNGSDIERIDAQLGRFRGRIERDQWVEQAKLLMSDNKTEFEAKFGRQ